MRKQTRQGCHGPGMLMASSSVTWSRCAREERGTEGGDKGGLVCGKGGGRGCHGPVMLCSMGVHATLQGQVASALSG